MTTYAQTLVAVKHAIAGVLYSVPKDGRCGRCLLVKAGFEGRPDAPAASDSSGWPSGDTAYMLSLNSMEHIS